MSPAHGPLRTGPQPHVMYARILRLYEAAFGTEPTDVRALGADGSARSYHRLVGSDGSTVIGGVGPEAEENEAFWSYSRAFRSIGLHVPEIFATDAEAGVWLMEDLGDTTLFAALDAERRRAPGSFPESMLPAYRRVLEWLPRFQVEGHRVVDYGVAYPRAAFDRQSIQWDLNYFKYHFLKLAHVPFREAALERDFARLVDLLLAADTDHFLYRDFQSRNVMLRDGEPWFIDYQGGRRGALQYDVASLLYDAKADIPDPERASLLEHYLDALEAVHPVDRAQFLEVYPGYVLVRILQAMGAYGYRGFFEQKARFLKSVPYAARNIAGILESGLPLDLPELETVFRRIVDRWSDEPDGSPSPAGLRVGINSFSYRRGYPGDETGHGGGFVFDCRAIPNPGRQERFRDRTGLDTGVARFIEALPEAGAFWDSVRALVDAQVDTYRARGFTSLTVSFGCTGGQHRSVYFAERLAAHLRERYADVGLGVLHRESARWPRPAGTPTTE
ncbi:MAG: phosphotransferase [Gemmatimonadetes bacterium]|nr:phosphotransferase [Gemmatimonadota bacterium]